MFVPSISRVAASACCVLPPRLPQDRQRDEVTWPQAHRREHGLSTQADPAREVVKQRTRMVRLLVGHRQGPMQPV